MNEKKRVRVVRWVGVVIMAIAVMTFVNAEGKEFGALAGALLFLGFQLIVE